MEKKNLGMMAKSQSRDDRESIDPRDSQSNISGIVGASNIGRGQMLAINSQDEVVKVHPCIEGFC